VPRAPGGEGDVDGAVGAAEHHAPRRVLRARLHVGQYGKGPKVCSGGHDRSRRRRRARRGPRGPPVAVELGERFRTGGFELHLVGGAVRDLLLHRPQDELDFATEARPEDVLRVLQGWADHRTLVGIRFGTVGAWKDGRRLEITTFRKEVYAADDRHPEVTFGQDLGVDLSRRDFTVNAMAVRLPERAFVDPFGAWRDLAAKRLETPLDPEVSFGDDPLRMLRAARFAARARPAPHRARGGGPCGRWRSA
jgi:poly(A) polymerase